MSTRCIMGTNGNRSCKGGSVGDILTFVLGLLMLIIVGFLISGCINISDHKHGESVVYGGTRYICKGLATPFVGATGPEAVYEESYSVLLFIPMLIDLPLEIVADTVTLPYDVIVK